MLIAIFFFGAINSSLELRAQHTGPRSFGMGLSHNDSGEVIMYIARESPLHDVNILVGDEIVELDGKPIAGRDILLSGALGASVDSATIKVRRPSTGAEFSAAIFKSPMHKVKAEYCGMLNKTTAFVKLTAFNADNLDSLESMLDSLVKGSNGYGISIDTALNRTDEARAYLHRQTPFRFTSTREGVAGFKADIDSYLDAKYGWGMQILMLDLRGNPNEFSREVLRSIRLFCEEHKISLVREI